jgi:transposase, IS5 family
MHQTCKGKQWYFGMKVLIGVDSESGLIHSLETTAAHVHGLTPSC